MKPIDNAGQNTLGGTSPSQTIFSGDFSRDCPGASVLGCGSYATIWRAKDHHTGKVFAVKTFRRDGLMRIPLWECKVATQLMKSWHPNIVRIHHVFENPTVGMLSIVMDLCSGGDLRQKICAARSEAERACAPYKAPTHSMRWLSQVLLALEYLHLDMNMLHLDIKPDNVVFDEKDNAKLIDFGFCNLGRES